MRTWLLLAYLRAVDCGESICQAYLDWASERDRRAREKRRR